MSMRTLAAIVLAMLGAAFLGCGGGGGGGGAGGHTNHAPTADAQSVATTGVTPVNITLTGTDPDGDGLTYLIDTMPSGGDLNIDSIPDIIYTPNGSVTGVDSFTFHVSDGSLDSAIVTVYVGIDNTAPTTAGDADTIDEDTLSSLTLAGADIDGDDLAWVVDTQPSHGTVDFSVAPDIVYTPATNYNGSDSFTFHVTDHVADSTTETVSITINPVNDPPVAEDIDVETGIDEVLNVTLVASDAEDDPLTYEILSGPSHGLLSGTAPDLSYDPDPGYGGTDSFTYRCHDGTEYGNTATVRITVAVAVGVWACGENFYGQLGDGSGTDQHIPVQVSGLSGVSSIAGGYEHSLALKTDGTVWAWGHNHCGQLGDGTTTQRLAPVQVLGLSGVSQVSAGSGFSLALKTDGTVRAWGVNGVGELGDGTTTDRHTPVQVSGLSGVSKVSSISAGDGHSLALKTDGRVWSWGHNCYGQLGDGTTTDQHTPIQVLGLSGVSKVSSISAGGGHSLALKTDGTVWAWGYNLDGQLGDGTTTQRLIPVQVSGLSEVSSIAGGFEHSLALKADGTVWAWGDNTYGQLGDGTTTKRLAPVQVSGLSEVSSISAGMYHSLALKTDGTVWAWGDNGKGQLGDGTTTKRLTPVQVSRLTGMDVVSGGGFHTVAVRR